MKIAFITQEDPFYIRIFFENFLKDYKHREEIQGVVICRTMGRKFSKLLKQMFDFYGPLDFLRVGARYVKGKLFRFLFRNRYFGRFFDIEHVCQYYKIPIIRCRNINDREIVNLLRQKNVDLIVSVAAPNIFKTEILRLPRHGCINIHNAKLPKYRGMLPNFWAMYHGEPNSAITIHTMEEEIDRGKILLQEEYEIRPEESLDQLIKRTKTLGAMYLIEVLNRIKQGTVNYREPEKTIGSYFSFPTPAQVKEFRRMGKRLL